MGVVDIILVVLIVGAAVYILYRSIWKKKGHCSGCNVETCETKEKGSKENHI